MQATIENNRLAEKERFFREFSVWPTFSDFDTEGWLSNFETNERWVAERLLTNFCYFNEKMTDGLLRSAIQRYFSTVAAGKDFSVQGLENLVRETAFVICEGETPHPTDSGNLFARKLRDQFGIPSRQIFWPSNALNNAGAFRRFVFVDDFTGSGNQFIETWTARHGTGSDRKSFQDSARTNGKAYAYCCCIATSKALAHIAQNTAADVLHPAHLLSDENKVILPKSRVWEGVDPNQALAIVKSASARAGYASEDCGQDDWRGFHCLGLALAFNHGIPDASLPIFFSQRNGWIPLIARADHA